MPRTEYTEDQITEALNLYLDHGPAQASRLCDIPSGTIRSWAHQRKLPAVRAERTAQATAAALERRTMVREELRSELLEKCMNMLERMDEAHIDFRGKDSVRVEFPQAPAEACRAYAVAAAVLLDKFRLEMGEVTGREQHVGGDLDAAAEKVLDEIAERRKGAVA